MVFVNDGDQHHHHHHHHYNLPWYFNVYTVFQVCRKRIEDACPKPTPALLRMRDRFDAPRDFRRRAFDIDGFPVETVDLKQVSN